MAPMDNKLLDNKLLDNKLYKAEQGVYALLGFAQRSGRLCRGGDAVAQAAAKGQLRLVLLAWDLSENSFSRFWQRLPGAKPAGITVWRFGSKAWLGSACGKPPCGILGLGDESFCRGIAAKLELLGAAEEKIAEKLL